MSAANDGGPAFPQSIAFNRNDDAVTAGSYFDGTGMSLRDAFAIGAMQGLLAQQAHPQCCGYSKGNAPGLAESAYEIADAMLEARKK